MTERNGRWRIVLSRDVVRTLDRLPRNLSERLGRAIERLAENPRPPGCIRLTNAQGRYRIRVGDWRIIYEIKERELMIVVLKVAPRGEAYRGL